MGLGKLSRHIASVCVLATNVCRIVTHSNRVGEGENACALARIDKRHSISWSFILFLFCLLSCYVSRGQTFFVADTFSV